MSRPDPGARTAPAFRRWAILALVLLLAAASAGAQDAASHPAPNPSANVESPDALKVTSRVLCMCGGCVNQTLHECTCGTAENERAKVAAALAAGKTPEDVIQEYVDNYGLQVLSSPDRKGFNLFGWLVPFIVTFIGLVALTFVLRGWIRRPAEAPAETRPAESVDPAEAEYRKRLERELREFKV